MVFFNYSRMQMSAKIVYYGPGLCGKTTNLTWIYGHTAGGSRGEMVSLETETDRTLFFDLLPIDVGNIGGFETRLQLYTVPGQVFYNTTRKLVLKGVDGVVFVADSQRPMLQANQEAFQNLEENLTEMGLSADEIPLVLQYNKRDLDDVLTVDELNQELNRRNWAWFESSAVHGQGVFETLKGISKLTLLSLRQRLDHGTSTGPVSPSTLAKAARGPAAVAPVAAAPAAAAPAAAASERPFPGLDRSSPGSALPGLGPGSAAAPPPLAETPEKPAASPASPPRRRKLDALGELERLRQQAIGTLGSNFGAPAQAARRRRSSNGHGQFFRDIQFTLKRSDFERAKRFSLTLSVEDAHNQVVESVRDLEVEIDNPDQLDKVLLKLNIALSSKD